MAAVFRQEFFARHEAPSVLDAEVFDGGVVDLLRWGGNRWEIYGSWDDIPMENHHVEWENHGKSQFLMGKPWKIIIFNGKTMENHHF